MLENKNAPFLVIEKILYEQVSGGKFVFKKGESYDFMDSVTAGNIIFHPCEGEELEKNVVILPEKPIDYESIDKLLETIRNFIHKWLDIPEDFEQFAVWYVLLTWFYDLMFNICYLSAHGDTGTGKSRFLDTIGPLCYRPIRGSGSVSVAGLKRIIDKWKGTLLIDEGDVKDSNEKNEFIKILNLGTEKNKPIFNCNKKDPQKLEFFLPYCPKLITRRRQFEDSALEARCITNVMEQTSRKDIKRNLTSVFFSEQETIRNKLLKFRLDYYDKINPETSKPIDFELEPRIEQTAMVFYPLFTHIPGAADKFKKFIIAYGQKVIDERAESFDGNIINALIDLVIDGEMEISSSDIENRLVRDYGFRDYKPANIGRRLSTLGLKPIPKKVNGKTKKVVPIEDPKFIGIAKRYCSDLTKVEMVSKVTQVTPNSEIPDNTGKKNIQIMKNHICRNYRNHRNLKIGFIEGCMSPTNSQKINLKVMNYQ